MVTNDRKMFVGISRDKDFAIPIGIERNITFIKTFVRALLGVQKVWWHPLGVRFLFDGIFFDETFTHGNIEHFGLFSLIKSIR